MRLSLNALKFQFNLQNNCTIITIKQEKANEKNPTCSCIQYLNNV